MMNDSTQYFLAVDVGNTHVTLGLWHAGRWAYEWRARTVHDKTHDEYAALLRNLLRDADLRFNHIQNVAIASVVPRLTDAFVSLSEQYIEVEPLVVTARIKLGIKIDVDSPDLVGADRIVNAAAVHHLYGGPAIVIDFGTATTFDVISTSGDYIGGSIAPGIGITLDALVQRTALLYKVPLVPPPSPIGKNTTHAIQSGLFWGYIDLIEGLVRRIRTDMPDGEHARIIATGGLASVVSRYSTVIQEVLPFLTLDGLRILYDLNRAL